MNNKNKTTPYYFLSNNTATSSNNRVNASLPQNSPPSSPLVQPSNLNQSKIDQVVRNFINKFVQLVLQNRISLDFTKLLQSIKSENETQKLIKAKLNKWFNLETDDLELYRNQIAPWRQQSFVDETSCSSFMPIYIDIILTVTIPKGKSLVLLDNKTRKQHVQTNEAKGMKQGILLESWGLTLNQTNSNSNIELPTSYKHSIVFFKGISTIVKLLPAYRVHKQLALNNRDHLKNKPKHFRLGYRISTQPSKFETPIYDDSAKNETYKIKQQMLEPIKTPVGNISFKVKYRTNCKYSLVDHETIFGINATSEEYVFGTNLNNYINNSTGCGSSTASVSTLESRSSALYKNTKNNDHQPGLSILRPNSRSSSNRSKLYTDSPDSFKSFPILGHNRNQQSGRAPSITMISPFKSPSLSSSPSNYSRAMQGKISTSIDKRTGTSSQNRIYSYTASSTLKLNSNSNKYQDIYKIKNTSRHDYFDNYGMGEVSHARNAITCHRNNSNTEMSLSLASSKNTKKKNLDEFISALDNNKQRVLKSNYHYDINTSVTNLEELSLERSSVFSPEKSKNTIIPSNKTPQQSASPNKEATKAAERISIICTSNSLPERGSNYARYMRYNQTHHLDETEVQDQKK